MSSRVLVVDDATVAQWLQFGWTYPCFLSKQYVIDFFHARGFKCVGEFPSVVSGKTRYIVLQKTTR